MFMFFFMNRKEGRHLECRTCSEKILFPSSALVGVLPNSCATLLTQGSLLPDSVFQAGRPNSWAGLPDSVFHAP